MSLPRKMALISLGLGIGCASQDETKSREPTDTDPTTDTPTHTDTGTPPELPVFDCNTAPTEPFTITQLDAPRGYHGLAFDDLGNIVGGDNVSLVKSTYDGDWSVWVPNTGVLEQMEYLPNGDLVVSDSDSGSLLRITPEGAVSTLASDVAAYGVILGPDEMIYAATNGKVRRIDPDTGDKEDILGDSPGWSPHTVAFNLDYSRLFIGAISPDGSIYYLDLDAELNPVGDVHLWMSGVGEGWHDGLGMDVCGNLYVADYHTASLYRVSPEQEVTRIIGPDLTTYGHGIEWGNGIGGWKHDAIYQPQPYDDNTVAEVHIGIPPVGWEGIVIPAG